MTLLDDLAVPLRAPVAVEPETHAGTRRAEVRQRSFDDLGTPLFDVTFCVVDLETTGGSADRCGITEVGAVKVRGGECLGTFQTLVNPGAAIPPEITVLTGITEAMVVPAPRIETVLPALLEFMGDAVVVGHNVRFDLSFIQAALTRSQRPRLSNRSVDTCSLARRLVRDEVPNCKLGTLATQLRLDHRPSHRALDDALATADLLHVLLERAAGLGVAGLDDLLALPKMTGHAQASKLTLTNHLPRGPGVYLFRDRGGRVLYVGKATNLRSRVRSYFSGDSRRKVGQLLRETQAIDHELCATTLEAAVREVRLIHEHEPRFNRQGTTWSRYPYLKLTLNESFPRLSVVRTARDDGALYLGPLPSSRVAKRVAEAIETAVPLRRCTANPGRTTRDAPCSSAQLGVSTCPCAGAISAIAYAAIVEQAVRGLRHDPLLLLAPLRAGVRELAAEQRFEEATDVRDRAAALAQALRRQRRFDLLLGAGRVIVEVDGAGGAELHHGRLVRSWAVGTSGADALPFDHHPSRPAAGEPVPRELADELSCIATWLDAQAGRVRLVSAEHGLASALPRVPSSIPANPRVRAAGSLAAMRQILLAMCAFLVTWIGLATLGFVVLRWRMGRANRVSPAVKSPAPLHWLWSPRLAARLHRRLRVAVAMIHLSPSPRSRQAPSLSVDELRRELEYQAIELDQHLVVAARHPRSHRRGLLAALSTQVAEVERLAVRLSGLTRQPGTPDSGWDATPTPPEVLERMGRQLDLLDAAQAELSEIERASGLVDLDDLLATTQAPVAVTPPAPPTPVPLETQRTGRAPRRG